MSNTLTHLYQTKVVPGLYQQYYQGATSSWMEANARGVTYTGGKYVIMSEMSVDGLGDYDRNLGFPRGNITGAKKQYELTQDRGREFLIDAADNDETGFLVTGASVMAEFQQTHVIPEVDSYRYSTIYGVVAEKAASNIIAANIDPGKITDILLDDIADVRDNIGDVPLVIIMSGLTQKYFGRDFARSLDYVNFARGTLSTKVKAVDGNPIVIVPSSRLKTAYTFKDGITAGQEAGGFAADALAGDIKWIITPVTGPIALGKIDKMRAFSPDEYQQAHAWKVDYRLYHDLWMTPKAYNNTLIRTGDIEAPASTGQ